MIILPYLIILFFQFFGIAAKVLFHIGKIRKENPSMKPSEVWGLIKHYDWDTLMWSGLILLLHLAVHGVMDLNGVQRTGWWGEWWFDMACAITLGYAGQDVLIRGLGTAKAKALTIAGGGSKSTTVIEENDASIKETTTTETIKPKD